MAEAAERVDPLHHLGEVMTRVARTLQQEHGDVEATLRAITAAAVSTVPNVQACSISYVTGRAKIQHRASSSDLARETDLLQEQVGQGPCLSAVWEEEVVRVDDVGVDGRWPEFAREASARGAGSMMCFQLFVEGDTLGAMNLYSGAPGAFDEECQEIGRMFAGHAAVALAGAEHEQNLRRGMTTRDVIGQAKGILMERHRITADQAFGVLARASQELNRKLADIAAEVAGTGAIPARNRRPE
ncbi:GAF and ANTAR domain-containing protein [Blastococcus montanus]|uniref:GAF and ANTAR domain-containing protein n=1 Tax=Blastococcus montanus TaxID=3144973 RepID=UPI003207CFD8